MNNIETMKLALEALECALSDDKPYIDKCKISITALRQAIEQAQQIEPEWFHGVDAHGCNRFYHNTESRPSEFNTPLYTTPPQRNPLTDKEIKAVHTKMGVTYFVPGDYDRHLFSHVTDIQLMKISRAIEAAHGIKGEA